MPKMPQNKIQQAIDVLTGFKQKKEFNNVINYLDRFKNSAVDEGILYTQKVNQEQKVRDTINTLRNITPNVEPSIASDFYTVLTDLSQFALTLRKKGNIKRIASEILKN